MKKILLILIMGASILLTSCEKDKVGGTSTAKVAGEWVVTADAAMADGSIAIEDPYGLGHFVILTYNTEANVSTKMWVNDNHLFWDFKVITDLNYDAATFSTEDFVDNYAYESQVKITNGKILYGAAKTPSGMPADSIVFYVSFDDDANPGDYGFDNYKVSGYRYTGLSNDEQ